jgi:putative ABC transport system permease protein
MFRHLPLILKNSLRNRRRSLLTIVSIAASLCLLGLLLALVHSFYYFEVTPDQALRLITRNRVSLANPLTLAYLPQIKQVPGVKEAMIFQWFGGTYKDARDPANMFARFAIEGEKLAVVNPEYKLSDAERAAFLQEQSACIVGRKTANRHNMKIGDRIVIDGDIFPIKLELTLRAIYDSELDNETLFFHYKYLNESLAASTGFRDVVSTFTIRLERVEDAATVAKAIDDKFRNAPLQTKTETEQAFALSFVGFLGNVKLILLSICAAVTFTILLVAGNTMAMAVRERVREVGVLKTLGYTNGLILTMLLSEAVLISLVGGVLGLLLTNGLMAWLRTMPSTFTNNSQITMPPWVVLLCLLIAVTIGVVSSIIPAWGASRRSIVEALRFTD